MTTGDQDIEAMLAAARSLEGQGRHADALAAYQQAFERSGHNPALAGDIGRLALRLGQHASAERLLVIHLGFDPASLDSLIHLAHALREQHRYDEAMALLAPAIQSHPGEAVLWAALGTVLTQQGRTAEALPFLDEALRLRPGAGGLLYARANALSDLGAFDRAIADYEAALGDLAEGDRDRVRTAMAFAKLARGDIAGGWDDYRARLSPHAAKPVVFRTGGAQPWPFDPDEAPGSLQGRSLALYAEQGLGDEVMFANIVPDVLRALGEGGRLVLVLEARLTALFARSYPAARVVAHRTWTEGGQTFREAASDPDCEFWAPMAAPLRRFRRAAADFRGGPYLTPDPARVAHWRAILAERPGRKVGILWKSLKLKGERLRQFAPFDLWAPVLKVPGVTIVNLQYGDCAAELAHARQTLGVEVWQPPGIDLKDDLDDVAALACALDLTLGFANATINLAGASGAPVWLITPGASWPKLGTDRYPWYPRMRCFSAAQAGGWEGVMAHAAEALEARDAA